MKDKFVATLIVVILISSVLMITLPILPVSASPAEIYVPGDYSTIQNAVGNASSGDTIIVAAGTYAGAIVDKNVTISGASGGASIIASGVPYKTGSGLCTAFRLDETADGAEIRNFTINCNSSESFYFAVFSRNVDNAIVDSLTVNDAVQGISNWGGSNWKITNNMLCDTEAAGGGGIAIFLGAYPPSYVECCGNLVQGNTITAMATAPDYTCPGISLSLDLRYGAYDDLTGNENVSNNQILDNNITAPGALNGVGIETGVIGLEGNATKIAATLGMIHDNTVKGNTIDGADMGVYFYTVTNLAIQQNEIKNCNEGIHIKDGSDGNTINYNNIVGNVIGLNMSARAQLYNNTIEGGRVGIWLGTGPYSISTAIKGNTITDFVKAGIVTRGAKDIFIEGNTISTTLHDEAPNGIDIGTYSGTNGTVKENEISGCSWKDFTGEYETSWSGSGILVIESGDSLEIARNIVHDCDVGMDIESDLMNITLNEVYSNIYGFVFWNAKPKVNYNDIYSNTQYGVYRTYDLAGVLNAEHNWWGHSTGPSHSPGLGDKVSDDVDYDPWLPCACTRAHLYIDPYVTSKDPGDKDTDFTVDVTIENFDNLMGFDIKLTWDSTLISYVSVDKTPLDAIWASWTVGYEGQGAGYYNLAALSTSTAASSPSAWDLFTLTFHIVKSCNFPLETLIHFDLVKLSDDTVPVPSPIDVIVTDGMYCISGTTPDLEFKVKWYNGAEYVYIDSPYAFEYCDWFEVEVYVTDICYDSKLTDYDLTITFDHTLVKFQAVDYWGVVGTGIVEYTTGTDEIRVYDDGFTWWGDSGLLFALTFHVEFECDKDHIWRLCDDNSPTFDIDITDAELNFTEGRTKTMSEIIMPVPLTITINFIRGDVNCDGQVTIADISAMAFYYGQTTPEMYDLNCDGIIDIYDLVTAATNYGYGT